MLEREREVKVREAQVWARLDSGVESVVELVEGFHVVLVDCSGRRGGRRRVSRETLRRRYRLAQPAPAEQVELVQFHAAYAAYLVERERELRARGDLTNREILQSLRIDGQRWWLARAERDGLGALNLR